MGADSGSQGPPMDGAAHAPYGIGVELSRTEVDRRRAQEETPEETNVMTSPIAGGVDCDLHPAVPHLTSLLPYLNDYWRDQVTTRGMSVAVLSPEFADHVAAGLAAGRGQAGLQP